MSDERKRDAGSSASPFLESLDSLRALRVVLIGGKGGVGKTTISVAAALRFAETKKTILFTTDPASNLGDLLPAGQPQIPGRLTLESLDAEALYRSFLEANLSSFLELGDRGTYLDREELRSFFELSLPGIDELMAWTRIGELAEENADAVVVVDTAPTGHTVRMLAAADHFRQLVAALDAMQEKHRQIARQLTRRSVRDAMDAFIDQFGAQAQRRRELLTDAKCAAFVPVLLSEPWVVEQTKGLAAEVRGDGLAIPFAILNRAVAEPDCALDRRRKQRQTEARKALAPMLVVDAPRSCAPLDDAERIGDWMRGRTSRLHEKKTTPAGRGRTAAAGRTPALPIAHLTFFAGKGGVGKTTCSASVALQLANANPSRRVVVLSVDPAHSLRDVFASEPPPGNLDVEIVDTRKKWSEFRETIGREIERAVDAITPRGFSVAYDSDAMQKLIEIAPPGADEIFAITRITDLLADETIDRIVVDTAPTGHFLRLLDLPRTAGEWVREFMRILLRYREVIPPGALGEELIRASRALTSLEETLRSDRCSVIVVTRPERVVVAETKRLIADVERRGMSIGAVIANYVTPGNDCACDRQMRSFEVAALHDLDRPLVIVERHDDPITRLEELATLVSPSS